MKSTIPLIATLLFTNVASAQEQMSETIHLDPEMEVLVPCVQDELPNFVQGVLTEDRERRISAFGSFGGASVKIEGEKPSSDIGYISQITATLNEPANFDLNGVSQTFSGAADTQAALDDKFISHNAEGLRQYLSSLCSPANFAPSA